jgi:putative ABC transport system substrate-binding protein
VQRVDSGFNHVNAPLKRLMERDMAKKTKSKKSKTLEVKTIGFLNTMSDKTSTDPLLVAFKAGLNKMGWAETTNYTIVQRSANGVYKKNSNAALEAKAGELVGQNVHLIVASGGLVAANAAKKATATIPTLVCIGRLPTSDEDPIQERSNIAGISFDGPNQNAAREAALGTAASNAFLVYNINSKMGQKERKKWEDSHSDVTYVEFGGSGQNDPNQIATKINEAKDNGATGLIISGDPFFTSQADAIVTAVKATGLPVCYPFKTYVKKHGQGCVGYGNDLEQAYGLLGYFAYLLLNTSAPPKDTIGILTMRPELFLPA